MMLRYASEIRWDPFSNFIQCCPQRSQLRHQIDDGEVCIFPSIVQLTERVDRPSHHILFIQHISLDLSVRVSMRPMILGFSAMNFIYIARRTQLRVVEVHRPQKLRHTHNTDDCASCTYDWERLHYSSSHMLYAIQVERKRCHIYTRRLSAVSAQPCR